MAVLTVMCVAACGFMPSGGNYPYDMYDRDIENVIELIKDPNGSSVGVLGVNSEEFPEGMHTLEQV
jgi:hypothetical protein